MYIYISVCDVDNKCVRMEIDIDMGWHLYLNGERYTNFYSKLEHILLHYTDIYLRSSFFRLLLSFTFEYIFRVPVPDLLWCTVNRTAFINGETDEGNEDAKECECVSVAALCGKISSFTTLLIIN